MSILIGAIVALIFAILSLWGLSVSWSPAALKFWVILLGAWFAFLVLIVTPYRMWRAQKERADGLENSKGDPPDWDDVDKINRFRLYEAACFWVSEKPNLPLSPAARDRFGNFWQSIKNGELSVLGGDLREVIYDAYDESRGRETKANPYWEVERDDLKTYAVLSGEQPPFLYPKERV